LKSTEKKFISKLKFIIKFCELQQSRESQ
jgi:hypothetical protein